MLDAVGQVLGVQLDEFGGMTGVPECQLGRMLQGVSLLSLADSNLEGELHCLRFELGSVRVFGRVIFEQVELIVADDELLGTLRIEPDRRLKLLGFNAEVVSRDGVATEGRLDLFDLGEVDIHGPVSDGVLQWIYRVKRDLLGRAAEVNQLPSKGGAGTDFIVSD